MPLHKDLSAFIESLNSAGVEYLVAGAFVGAWHGFTRNTTDIDILVRPEVGYADAVLSALHAFGFGSLDITRDDLCQPGMVVQLGVQPNRIDLITSIDGVDFADAWASRVSGTIDGIRVEFIGRDALIRNKESTGRPKDLGDAHELRKRNPNR